MASAPDGMILIADSGSTKTHWVLLDGVGERHCTTAGLNPLFADSAVFGQAGSEVCARLQMAGTDVGKVFFYGAGCGTESSCQTVGQWLGQWLPHAHIEVGGDLLGACRATCGHHAGLVGILGTGSNMCYYDGQRIARHRVSTGFILGDEGSGNHIGKRLLKDYLEERMPERVRDMFHDDYPFTTAQFMDYVYRCATPNRYLASLAEFADRHHEEPYIGQVLQQCFGAFFDQMSFFGPQASLPLNLVGGLVSSFEQEIRAEADKRGVRLDRLVPSPIEGLVLFHSQEAFF